MMIEFTPLVQAWLEAGATELERSGIQVADVARRKAPIRQIFQGAHRQMRFKSVGEIEQDRGMRASLGLGPERAAPPGMGSPTRHPGYARSVTSVNRPYSLVSERAVGAPGHLASPQAEAMVSHPGRFEVTSGRANVPAAKGGQQVGGRLRREIYATRAEVTGKRLIVKVISPTPYAKFQEFGTHHNAAHPFLRPAAEESREVVTANLRTALYKSSRMAAAAIRSNPIPVRLVMRVEVSL